MAHKPSDLAAYGPLYDQVQAKAMVADPAVLTRCRWCATPFVVTASGQGAICEHCDGLVVK